MAVFFFLISISAFFRINFLTKKTKTLIKNSIKNRQKNKYIKQKIINEISMKRSSLKESIIIGSPHMLLGTGEGKPVFVYKIEI